MNDKTNPSSDKSFWNGFLWKVSKLFRYRFWCLVSGSGVNAKLLTYCYLISTCFMSVASLGLAIKFCSLDLIFPSLGPTIFMQFYAPGSPMSAPRNTILGHMIGCLVGLFFLYVTIKFGTLPGSFSLRNILILSMAVACCATIMGVTGLLHPPAASTTLLIVCGYLGNTTSILAFMASAIFVSYEAWLVHFIAGVKFPLWRPYARDIGPQIYTKLGKIDLSRKNSQMNLEEIASKLAARQVIK